MGLAWFSVSRVFNLCSFNFPCPQLLSIPKIVASSWVLVVSCYNPPKALIYILMMALSMKSCLYSYGSNLNETIRGSKPRGVCGFCPSFGSSQSKDAESRAFPVLSVDFMGKPLHISDQKGKRDWSPKSSGNFFIHVCEFFYFSVFTYFEESVFFIEFGN